MGDIRLSEDFLTILSGLGVLILSVWFFYLWRYLKAIITHWKGRSVSVGIRGPRPARQPWSQRNPILFCLGTLIIFFGFALVIVFKERSFVWLILTGILYLSALFFRCYYQTFSQTEKSEPKRPRTTADPEQLLLFTHSSWIADRPGLFWLGVAFLPLGLGLTIIYADTYFMLLSVFGLIFLLQLWSFCQLNILTVTDQRTTMRTGLPADSLSEIPHTGVEKIRTYRTLFQRLFGTSTLIISGSNKEELIFHTKFPALVTGLIEEHSGRILE